MGNQRDGEHKLTARERQVLELMGSIGHSKGVAAELGISTRTVEHYLSRARQKLGAETTVQALNTFRQVEPVSTPADITESHALDDVEIATVPRNSRILARVILCCVLALVGIAGYFAWPPKSLASQGIVEPIFSDDFNHGVLNDWTHRQGVGRVSATESPGKLRYTLTGKSSRTKGNAPYYLYRTFRGKYWELEFKAAFKLPYRQHGRQFHVYVVFGDDPFDISRNFTWWVNHDSPGKDTPKHAQLCATASEPGRQDTRAQPIESEKQEPVTVVMARNGNAVRIEYVRADGTLSGHLETGFQELPDVQSIVVFGQAYDNDADLHGIGGWIDFEYFHGRAMAPQDW